VTRKKKKKPQTKRMNRSARPHSDFPSLDQDETFAYIAGYTEGGFAYGVTWEEWEQLEQESSTSSELEIERKPPGL
jgi:hypothetical protein